MSKSINNAVKNLEIVLDEYKNHLNERDKSRINFMIYKLLVLKKSSNINK